MSTEHGSPPAAAPGAAGGGRCSLAPARPHATLRLLSAQTRRRRRRCSRRPPPPPAVAPQLVSVDFLLAAVEYASFLRLVADFQGTGQWGATRRTPASHPRRARAGASRGGLTSHSRALARAQRGGVRPRAHNFFERSEERRLRERDSHMNPEKPGGGARRKPRAESGDELGGLSEGEFEDTEAYYRVDGVEVGGGDEEEGLWDDGGGGGGAGEEGKVKEQQRAAAAEAAAAGAGEETQMKTGGAAAGGVPGKA